MVESCRNGDRERSMEDGHLLYGFSAPAESRPPHMDRLPTLGSFLPRFLYPNLHLLGNLLSSVKTSQSLYIFLSYRLLSKYLVK